MTPDSKSRTVKDANRLIARCRRALVRGKDRLTVARTLLDAAGEHRKALDAILREVEAMARDAGFLEYVFDCALEAGLEELAR